VLRGLDLFSGIGGLTLGLEPWVIPVAYCEIDPYCRGVLLSRMHGGGLPVAPIWDDVRTLRGDDLPPVDIIVGGFPCQDVSSAGSRKGLDGERSGLYRELIRLVGELRPKFVFLENVAAIRPHAWRVVQDLAGLGFDCRWGVISAAQVGAPHKRDRWWLAGKAVAHTSGGGRTERGFSEPTGVQGQGGPFALGCSEEQQRREDRERSADLSWYWSIEPGLVRVVHGISGHVVRIRSLGNAVVPYQARIAFRTLMGLP
jgi:DNA (cytosine-5)-methyltransferase 1